MQTVRFGEIDCIELKNDAIALLISQSFGPRILSLKHTGGQNMLAELPKLTAECTNVGIYHFYGGHRLWHAPEDMARTYIPDDSPVEITALEHGVQLVQAVEAQTGMQKSMEITLPGKQAQVTIKHHLVNHGLWPVECAAWAISQLRPGGIAILPQTTVWTEKLPNRHLVMWPYTDMSSPHVQWRKDRIQLEAKFTEGSFKIGYPNPRGWLAYWLDGSLFIKRASYFTQESYCDFGCSSECFVNDKFIELETISPMKLLQPGDSITHIETWELHKDIQFPADDAAFMAFVEQLDLE
jgi:hypothetical protein